MARRYEPNPKHKPGPAGVGSLCPEELTIEEAQGLLEQAITDPTTSGAGSLWIYSRGWVFRARPTDVARDVWHGYPVPGCDVPKEVMQEFRQRNWVTDRKVMRAIYEQRSLPGRWPSG